MDKYHFKGATPEKLAWAMVRRPRKPKRPKVPKEDPDIQIRIQRKKDQ